MSIDISKIQAIDPPGCGCMECITGEYIPYDSYYIDEVLEAILDGVIAPPRNNLNDGTLVIWRLNGSVYSEVNSTMISRSDILIVPPNSIYLDEEDEETVVNVSTIEEDYEDDEDKQKEVISSVIDSEATASNPGNYTLVLYRSPYGETGIINLYSAVDEDEVVILLYED
jgi:hypothetical protein